MSPVGSDGESFLDLTDSCSSDTKEQSISIDQRLIGEDGTHVSTLPKD